MKLICTLWTAILLTTVAIAGAVDHRLEPLAEGAPADAISEAVAKRLMPAGARVFRGQSRTVCDIWLCKDWPAKAGFAPSAAVLYPFAPGELMGVIRYPNKASDFRNQDIPAGTYTVRYAQQPVDGNHVGTSDTRDFLLLIPAAEDKDPKPMAEAAAFKLSPKTSGGTHPAMLSLLRVDGESESLPAIRHDEARELWSVRMAGQAKTGDKAAALPIEVVIVGHAPE